MVDELVLGALVATQRPPGQEELQRAGTELRIAASQVVARGFDDDPVRFHADPPPLRGGDLTLRRARWLRQRFDWMSFESGFRPRPELPGHDRYAALTATRTAHAALLRRSEGDRPWVVCIHGFGTGAPYADFVAFRVEQLFRDEGYHVALPVLPLHGRRRRSGDPAMLSYDLASSIHGLAQAVWDVRRLVRWIRSVSDAPVALHGVSLGAGIAGLVAGLEPVDAVIAGVPAVDLPELFAHHSPAHIARATEAAGLDRETAEVAFRPVSPLALVPQVVVEHRSVYAGLGDRFVPTSQATALWRHWAEPAIRWYPGGHVGFVWSRPAARFVTDRLASVMGRGST
jgi:hypothetical protein